MEWRGHLYLDIGRSIYDGPAGVTTPHAHHAYQIVVASDVPLRLASPWDVVETDVAVIPPDVTHAFSSGSPRSVIVYVAPESRAGRQLAAELPPAARAEDWRRWAAPLRGRPVEALSSWETARMLADGVVERLGAGRRPMKPWPPAIQQLVTRLPMRIDGELRLPTLAAELEISASRLSHLVTEHLGIPFRPYVLWLRLRRAAEEIARGHTVTDAAHAAGFADGPHLTRSFRRMFGIAPSEVAGFAIWHVAKL